MRKRIQFGTATAAALAIVLGVCVFQQRFKLESMPSALLAHRSNPQPPAQPLEFSETCSNTRAHQMFGSEDGSWTDSDGAFCWLNDFSYTVRPTPTEMRELIHRPRVTFTVDGLGNVTDAKILRSSGSLSLDQRTIGDLRHRRRSPIRGCGRCTVSATFNVDFNGPVWILDYLTCSPQPRNVRSLASCRD